MVLAANIISAMPSTEQMELSFTMVTSSLASAGSTFKRPEGYFAGKLIQDAGMQGHSVGDAQVSTKHAGFVVNTGNATAADVLQVIRDVQAAVADQFGVTLETEVRMWGFDPTDN